MMLKGSFTHASVDTASWGVGGGGAGMVTKLLYELIRLNWCSLFSLGLLTRHSQ